MADYLYLTDDDGDTIAINLDEPNPYDEIDEEAYAEYLGEKKLDSGNRVELVKALTRQKEIWLADSANRNRSILG